jgi:Tfp pilus assembly protein PilN
LELNMNRTNLIPLQRQLRDERIARLKRWAWTTSGLCLFVVAAIACCAAWTTQSTGPTSEDFAKVATDLSKANQEAGTLRADLNVETQRLRSRQLIFEQPDYSLLLRLIAQQVDDDVVLSRCEFRQAGTERTDRVEIGSVKDQKSKTKTDSLQIWGFARSQPAVAAFMLQLESTGIFQKVSLLRSSEQPLLNGQVAAFEIQCVPGPSNQGPP